MPVEPNPITEVVLENKRARALSVFPELRGVDPADYASLAEFADGSPERFLNLQTKAETLSQLRAEALDPTGLLGTFLRDHRGELDIAFRALAEVNRLCARDVPWPGSDNLAELTLIDRDINPSYLKLAEAVLSAFLLPIAMRERRLRGKSTANIPLHQRIEEARRTSLQPRLAPLDRTIRNAIAHGTVGYGQLEVTYQDRNGSRAISPREMAGQFDSLLDTCNGMAAAFRCFYLLERTFIRKHQIEPPLHMLLNEVRAQTEMPSWHVGGALELDVPATGRQLNLLVRNHFFDDFKATYSCLITAAAAERFMPGFDRYFLSIRGRGHSVGWAAFNGLRLAAARRSASQDVAEIAAAVTDPGIVIFPPFLKRYLRVPRPLRPLGTFWEAFRANRAVARTKRWMLDGVRVRVRHNKIHRKTYYAAIEAYVALEIDSLDAAISFVRSNARALFWLASASARSGVLRSTATALPLGYGTVNVYLSDFRVRRLESYGLGDQLLCRLTLKRFGQVRVIPLATSIPEAVHGYRIDWNSNAVTALQLGI